MMLCENHVGERSRNLAKDLLASEFYLKKFWLRLKLDINNLYSTSEKDSSSSRFPLFKKYL